MAEVRMRGNQLLISVIRWHHGFCNFYLAKNPKIAQDSATTEAGEKICTVMKSVKFQKFFDMCLTNFENYQILLNKINHRFIVTTKLFINRVKETHYMGRLVAPL